MDRWLKQMGYIMNGNYLFMMIGFVLIASAIKAGYRTYYGPGSGSRLMFFIRFLISILGFGLLAILFSISIVCIPMVFLTGNPLLIVLGLPFVLLLLALVFIVAKTVLLSGEM